VFTTPNEKSGNTAGSGPSSVQELKHPELERRRPSVRRVGGGAAAPPGDVYARTVDSTASATVPTIYLIERAAIRLRRLRWAAINTASAGGTEESHKAEADIAVRDLVEALKMYVRQPETPSSKSDSVVRRMGMSVRAFFGLDKERKP
jgi:hypothetical protein